MMSNQPIRLPQPELERERRLLEIRREAESRGQVQQGGIRPLGAPFPKASPSTGYYGIPLLKPPQWTHQIPLYFFVGGAAGAAAVVSAIADYTGADRKLVRDARWIAAAGAVISPALLIADLGRPERFLNMMRVFKLQSPMSVGAWTLLGFSSAVSAATFAGVLRDRLGSSFPLTVLENAGEAAAIPLGLGLATYTGVLLGATAVPVWNKSVADLPLHFAASGIGAAVGMLELLGHSRRRALQALGLGAALFELWQEIRLESRTHSHLDPLKHGTSGTISRAGGVLSGPIPAALRLASVWSRQNRANSLRRWAAASSIVGSLFTRVAWLRAGSASAKDWRAPLEISQELDQ